jgi:hypothetical protein
VHSNTDPQLVERDPYYQGGKEYGPWPPYPEWQDMPLRRFGNGYRKKLIPHLDSHMAPGGFMVAHEHGHVLESTELTEHDMVDGLPRTIGFGRRKYDRAYKSHMDGYAKVSNAQDEKGIGRGDDYVDDLQVCLGGKGRHKFWEKDHLRNDASHSSTTASSLSSRIDSSKSSIRTSRSAGSLSTIPRSSRSSQSARSHNPMS